MSSLLNLKQRKIAIFSKYQIQPKASFSHQSLALSCGLQDGDNNTPGTSVREAFIWEKNHACGISIEYDTYVPQEYDNFGIKEIYLIGCKLATNSEPTSLQYYLLTNRSFRGKDLICDKFSSLTGYSIWYQPYQAGVDNEGMTGFG